MASIFGHGIVGFTLSKILDQHNTKRLLICAILSTIIPDIDVIGFNFEIPYSHPLGHRGFTHSIVFAVLWALTLMFVFGRKNKGIWFFVVFLSTVSHGVLDAMTSGGKGVGFFIPFDNDRYFFPFIGIKVSPLGIENFFSEWGMLVIFSEIKFVLLPCFIIFGIRFLIQSYNSQRL